MIPAGFLDKAHRAPGAEQSWVHQTLTQCLGSPWACWESLNRTGRGPCWCHSFSAFLAHHFTFRALPAQPRRPGQHGAGAMTLVHLPQPCRARSAPEPAAARPSPARLGGSAVLGDAERAGWGARLSEAAGGPGIPQEQEKELGLCRSELCPAPSSPPSLGSHRLANLHSAAGCGQRLAAAAAHTDSPCERRRQLREIPQPSPAQPCRRQTPLGAGMKPAQPRGRRGGGSHPEGPLPASAGCRNGGFWGAAGGQRARSALGLTLTPPAGRSRSAKSRKRLSAA